MQRLQRLNLTPHVVNGVDVNPCTRPEITLYADTLTLGPSLDAEELMVFKAQFATLLAAPGSEERRLMLDRLPIYITALRCIKQELNGVKFAGMNAGDTEVGFGFIRPQFTRAAAAYRTNWIQALLVNAWTDWLFELATAPFSVGRDFGLVITHLKSLVTPIPFMSECRFQVGRTGVLLPLDTRALRLADTVNQCAIIPIPSMVLKPQETFYARCKADVAGNAEVQLGGLVIGLGRALRQEVPTWV